MIQIKQVFIDKNEIAKQLSEENHPESVMEYLPQAKGYSYNELLNGEKAVFLAIRCSKDEEMSKKAQLLFEPTGFMRLFSAVYKALEEQQLDIVSISKNDAVKENDILLINALIQTNGLLSENIINNILESISIKVDIRINSLNFRSESLVEVQKTKKASKPIETNISKTEKSTIEQNQTSEENSIDEEMAETEDNSQNDISSADKNPESLEKSAGKEANSKTDVFALVNEINKEVSRRKSENTAKISNMSEEAVEPNTDKSDDLQPQINSTEANYHPFKAENSSHFIEKNIIFTNSIEEKEKQRKIYNDKSSDIPFLNAIDNYIPESNIKELEAEAPFYEIHEPDEMADITCSREKFRKSFVDIMSYLTENEKVLMRRTLLGEVEKDSFEYEINHYIDSYLQIPSEDREIFVNKIHNAFFSYYALTPAINDPDISDIRVLSPTNINVKVKGKHYVASDLHFIDEADYNRFIEGLILRNHINIVSPIIVFTDLDFDENNILRFNLCLGNINSTRMPYLHIRKIPKKKVSLQTLIKRKMLDTKIAAYLLDKVITSRGILFTGPSASGKTTLMNALVDYIPKDKSIMCAQESEELFSNIHPNAYFQHMMRDNLGRVIVGLSELGQNGLLCDSGYFIIGEIKGAEARDLLRASNTGHKCWCSVHSQSSEEAITRLADYVKLGTDYTLTEATRMLKDLEVIVYIENYKVKEISEIVGYDEDKKQIIYKSIYKSSFEK